MAFTPIKPQARSPLSVMSDVIFAVFMRELKTRFGTMKLGVAWLVLEPLAFVLVFSSMWTLRGITEIAGMPVVLMILTGMMTVKFFTSTMTSFVNCAQANKPLFGYRQVKPLDCLIARGLLELIIFIVVYLLLLLLFYWYGVPVAVFDPLMLLLINIAVFFLAAGLGMLLAVVSLQFPDISKIVGMFSLPIMFASGSFFTADMIPQQYWPYLSWNPLLHATELGRTAFFVSFNSRFADPSFFVLCVFVIFTFGLLLFPLNRRRFISA